MPQDYPNTTVNYESCGQIDAALRRAEYGITPPMPSAIPSTPIPDFQQYLSQSTRLHSTNWLHTVFNGQKVQLKLRNGDSQISLLCQTERESYRKSLFSIEFHNSRMIFHRTRNNFCL